MSTNRLELETAQRVSVGLVRLMKLLQAMRHHAPRVHQAVDSSAYPLLFNLAAEPRRVSALADCIHSDVSTVSRQVSNLVGHGLLEKVSDPEDGRAQVVRLSDAGQELLKQIQQQRNDWFRTMLEDWSSDDAAEFARYLERFGDALEASRERLSRWPASPDTTSPTLSASAEEN